jgi:hypothetical protein
MQGNIWGSQLLRVVSPTRCSPRVFLLSGNVYRRADLAFASYITTLWSLTVLLRSARRSRQVPIYRTRVYMSDNDQILAGPLAAHRHGDLHCRLHSVAAWARQMRSPAYSVEQYSGLLQTTYPRLCYVTFCLRQCERDMLAQLGPSQAQPALHAFLIRHYSALPLASPTLAVGEFPII